MSSERSRTRFLPKFPRLQRLQKRRQDEALLEAPFGQRRAVHVRTGRLCA